MKIELENNQPYFQFCCEEANTAWKSDALVIVPVPYGDHDPLIFTAAIDFEGGSALQIRFCPFCGLPVQRSFPIPQPARS